MYAFDFHRAKTIDDAAEQLGADENARLLAGGMSLIPVLRLRLGSATTLIDLNGLDELRGITATPDGFRIGAMTTHYAVSASPMVREMLPALALLASRIGDPLVRNRGTIGGSLAHINVFREPVDDPEALGERRAAFQLKGHTQLLQAKETMHDPVVFFDQSRIDGLFPRHNPQKVRKL
jgi:xanthine dehydrogenase iron-sulfur cluster and FAD-binding subunit A